jgi:hypothetical protein
MGMAPNPSAIEERIQDAIAAWEEHAADATFSEVTLAQFKAKVKPSLDARASIKDLETQLEAARIDRDNADAVSTEATLAVVCSVRGDPNHGENGALYAAMGYVRKADRQSGLTRRSADVTPLVKAA